MRTNERFEPVENLLTVIHPLAAEENRVTILHIRPEEENPLNVLHFPAYRRKSTYRSTPLAKEKIH